jgi:hypothetical protein
VTGRVSIVDRIGVNEIAGVQSIQGRWAVIVLERGWLYSSEYTCAIIKDPDLNDNQ